MKRIVLIIVIVLILAAVLAVLGYYILRPDAPVAGPNNPSFPSAGGQGGVLTQTMTVMTRSGESVAVQDFIHNGVTERDTVNPNQYYLAGKNALCELEADCYSGAPSDAFDIVYFVDEDAFAIGLTAEPLGEARKSAEQFLLKTLGISQEALCALDYFVTTDVEVSEQYAGADLGFSFCPDAVKLP